MSYRKVSAVNAGSEEEKGRFGKGNFSQETGTFSSSNIMSLCMIYSAFPCSSSSATSSVVKGRWEMVALLSSESWDSEGYSGSWSDMFFVVLVWLFGASSGLRVSEAQVLYWRSSLSPSSLVTQLLFPEIYDHASIVPSRRIM